MNHSIICDVSFDFSLVDNEAFVVFIVGYSIVFLALVALYYVFNTIPKIIKIKLRNKLREEGRVECAEEADLDISGEVNAAISSALFMYFNEMHDEESGVLTVKRVSKRYSPWSSKIYSVMNNQLNRKK